MSTVDERRAGDAPTASSASTRRDTTVGVLAMTGTTLSNQVGAALGALAFPVIGPLGVVAVRQVVTAVALRPFAAPRLRRLSRSQWRLLGALAVVFGVMNLSLYSSVDRIGLALAMTLELLGPLGMAIAAGRSRLDYLCAGVVTAGVLVLTAPGPSSDLLGIALALLAAACWAAYIALNREMGRRLDGVRGASAAATLSAVVWVPVGIVVLVRTAPSPAVLGYAVACGVLASAVPYAVDILTLRRVPTSLFGVVMSLNPLWAALVGLVVLHQQLAAHEWVGMAVIMVGNVVVVTAGRRRPTTVALPEPG